MTPAALQYEAHPSCANFSHARAIGLAVVWLLIASVAVAFYVWITSLAYTWLHERGWVTDSVYYQANRLVDILLLSPAALLAGATFYAAWCRHHSGRVLFWMAFFVLILLLFTAALWTVATIVDPLMSNFASGNGPFNQLLS